MGRLINADALLQEFEMENAVHNTDLWHITGIKAFIENAPTVQSNLSENLTGWIPADMEVPPNDKYVMVSFENFSLPDIARYEEDSEGGAFYPGDEERSYASFGLFVNAWQPLPDPYRPKGENDDNSTNG